MRKLTLLTLWVALLAVAPFVSNCSDPLELSPTGPDQIDTIFSIDTMIVPDTLLAEQDTIYITDTVYSIDTVGYGDTLIIVDTIPLGIDTVVTLDTLIDTVFIVDTVYFTDTVTITDTVHTTDTVTVSDTVTVLDTLFQIDTVLQIDTVHTTDTLTLVDTVTVVDTVEIILPPPDERHCSELDSDDKSINWVLDNDAGRFRLTFTGDIERDRPEQQLRVTIDGTVYTWTPAESSEFTLDLDLAANTRVDIEILKPPAYGHSIDVCLDVTPL